MNRFSNWLLTSGLFAPAIGIVMMYVEEGLVWLIDRSRHWLR